MAETQETIAEKPEVRQELARATGQRAEKEAKEATGHNLSFLPYLLLMAGCAVLHILTGTRLIPFSEVQIEFVRRLLRGAALILIVLGVLALVYGGFSYTKETHDAKVGPIELSVKDKETVNVPMWAGIGAVVIGAGLLLAGKRN